MSIPKVTIIGSCRVYTTLKYLEESGKIEINNKSVYGYVHTTKEILQVLKNAKGLLNYDEYLAPFISKNPKKIALTKEVSFEDNDIFVIEISSIKLVKIANTFLKINEASKYLKEYAPLFLSKLHRKTVTQKALNLEYDTANSLTQKLINSLEIIDQKEKSFEHDISLICDLVPKNKNILFISHFDMMMKDKDIRIPSRVKIVKWLEKFVSKNKANINMYNPRILVEKVGIENSLDDVAHYKEVFKPILAEDIYKKYFWKV
jgi:uncharacterized short protein YbdD (DUF466 family)